MSRFGSVVCGLIVCRRGSEVVWWWFSVVWPECIRSSFGSDVVQMWFGDVVQRWFGGGSVLCGLSVSGPALVQMWCSCGSAMVPQVLVHC